MAPTVAMGLWPVLNGRLSGVYKKAAGQHKVQVYTIDDRMATLLHNLCGDCGGECENARRESARKTMAGSQKKVVVRLSGGEVLWGYLPQSGILHEGQVALMGADGRVNTLAFNEIQVISYVRDFNLDDPVDPERLGRRSFGTRPRGDGLWVRLGLPDQTMLEGLMAFDLGFLETILQDQGVFVTPPDGRGNVLRVFVPRRVLRSLEVLGWVTAPSRRAAQEAAKPKSKKAKRAAALAEQPGLFEEQG